MKVVVAQKSSREHFAIARALYRQGMLAQLVADWYAPPSPFARLLLNCLPRSLVKRALAAQSPELPPKLVNSLNSFGLLRRVIEGWSRRKGRPYEGYVTTGSMFARKIASISLPAHDVFFGYSYDSLEAIEAEKSRGILTVVDQVDPSAFEHELVMEEAKRWKSYAISEAPPPEAYFHRNRQEWEAADIVIVNSRWCKEALVNSGAPRHKLEILPLAYEIDVFDSPRWDDSTRNLRILWLGNVCLRKGFQYLIEAAKMLESYPIEFLIAGRVQISTSSVREAPCNVKFLGQVPRSDVGKFYQQGDIFVLPTISDGFAMTQLEALAHGLPVIVTPNCGQVVEDGVTGFIVPARDSKALAHAILRFSQDRELAATMGSRCRESVQKFSIANCGTRLVEIINSHKSRKIEQNQNQCQPTT
jgi:glycosyltransferase involved in cell wall biosynthesis